MRLATSVFLSKILELYKLKLQMMKNFKKIKLIKGGGLELHFNDPVVSGSETYGRTLIEKSTVDIHPDMKTALDSLKPEFAKSTGFTFIVNEMISRDDFKATDEQSKVLEKLRAEIYQRIVINGISIKGTEEKPVIVILGAVKYPKSNAVMSINPKIELEKDVYGFEQDMAEKVEAIVEEAIEYQNGKQAQLEIAFQEEED